MEIFQTTTDDGVMTLTMSGRLDADTTDRFAEAFNRVVDQGNHRVILECAGVDYMNSVGLRALMAAAKRIATLGGRLVLCAPHPRVVKLLDVAGFVAILPIAETRADALARVR
jgi:anti-anti-sigma factor